MSKFSDLPHFLLEEYFNNSLSQGDENTNIAGPWHRHSHIGSDGQIVYENEDMIGSQLHGNRQSIIVAGGYWTKLWIKVTNLDGELPEYPGFVEYQFRVNNNYLDSDEFILEKGSLLTVAASANSPHFTSGSEVYFKRGTYLYQWLVKNSDNYRDYFNTNKTFLYFGKIYTHREENNSYHIIYDGMKNYVMAALPRENRTDKLTEFMRLYFDKVYHPIHNKMKDLSSLLDPKEVDIRFIDYLARAYLIDTDITLSETALREWVEYIVYILKRKGTYTSLLAIWKTFLEATTNVLNVYGRWHNASDPPPPYNNPLGYFADILHELWYEIVPEGCSGSYWYKRIVLNAISPGQIHIQNNPSTVWYVGHKMYSKDVMVQVYNGNFYRVWPIKIDAISTAMLKITFAEPVYGYAYIFRGGDSKHKQDTVDASWTISHNLGQEEVLVQFKNTDYNKMMPSLIELQSTNGYIAAFAEKVNGVALTRSETLNSDLVIVRQLVSSNTWNLEHKLTTLHALTNDNRGVFVQCYNDDNERIQPTSLSLVDGDNCTLIFEENVSGYAVIKASENNEIILPDYSLDDMVLSPHYKVEIDISCEPLDDDDGYILKEETIDRLITNWELMRPVTRFSHYHILVAPKTNFTGEYVDLYGQGYNANLSTKYVVSAGELLPEPDKEYMYFRQYGNRSVWKITHTLNTDDLIVQCYDSEGNRIWPNEVKTIGLRNLEIIFGHSVNGVASIIETTSPSLSGATTYFPDDFEEQWDINHNLGILEVLSQFDNNTRNKIVPSGVTLLDEDNAIAIWNASNLSSGYALSSAVSYVHNEFSPSNNWTINHNLSCNSIVAQFFDFDNVMIIPDSLTINNSNYCTATFGTSGIDDDDVIKKSGYAILRPVFKTLTEVDIMEDINSYGHWEIGVGTSGSAYDPLTTNSVETLLISGSEFEYDDDDDYYYLSFEANKYKFDEEAVDMTEIAWVTIIDGVSRIRFYSYFSPIHKPESVWLNSHFRIKKGQV